MFAKGVLPRVSLDAFFVEILRIESEGVRLPLLALYSDNICNTA